MSNLRLPAGTYQIDTMHTQLGYAPRHLGRERHVRQLRRLTHRRRVARDDGVVHERRHRHETTWFLAVAILMAAAALGRIVGIAIDGFDKAVLPPLVIELVIGGVLLAAHLVLE